METRQQAPIFKTFFRYVSFSVLGMMGLSCYILADTFFIAQGLGADGLTALNLAVPVYSFIHGLGLMAGMGGATRYSILKSQNQTQNANQIFTLTAALALFISAIFVLLGLFFAEPISRLLGAEGAAVSMTTVYLKTILLYAPFFLLNNVLLCFVRNDGYPRLAMAAMLLGSFSNILLDYLFIFPANMGMFGAALATGLAPVISIGTLSVLFFQRKNHFKPVKTKLSFSALTDISSLGLSSLVTELSSGIVIIVFNMILLKLEGNTAVAAYSIIANLSLVVLAIMTGIGQGIQPIISSNFGKGNSEYANQVYRLALIVSCALSLVVYSFAWIYAQNLCAWFNRGNNALLQEMAVNGLKIYFAGFLFAGFNIITAALLSAMARPIPAFLLSMLRGFLIILPCALLLSALLQMNGIWLSFTVTEIIVCIIAGGFAKNYIFPKKGKKL